MNIFEASFFTPNEDTEPQTTLESSAGAITEQDTHVQHESRERPVAVLDLITQQFEIEDKVQSIKAEIAELENTGGNPERFSSLEKNLQHTQGLLEQNKSALGQFSVLPETF
jgi:hypothetical protein